MNDLKTVEGMIFCFLLLKIAKIYFSSAFLKRVAKIGIFIRQKKCDFLNILAFNLLGKEKPKKPTLF